MSIRPMPEDYKNVFFFTKMLLRIVINPTKYHCNATVKLEKSSCSLLSQKFFHLSSSTKAQELLSKVPNR